MKYKHIQTFKIKGLVKPQEQITTKYSDNISWSLVNGHSELFEDLDKRMAIANSFLHKVFGNANFEEDFLTIINSKVSDIKAERVKDDNATYLIFSVTGVLEEFSPDAQKEANGLHIALDDKSVGELPFKFEDALQNILTGITLTSNKVIGYDKLNSGTILYRQDGGLIYPFNFKAGLASLTISSPLSKSEIEMMGNLVSKLQKNRKALDLDKVIFLLLTALKMRKENFRSYLTAWTALEIFINKNYSKYETAFYNELKTEYHPEAREKYFNRIKDVMKEKSKLTDKFSIIAIQLSPTDADKDLELMKKLKTTRDRVTHGEDISEQEMDVEKTISLLRKYLLLHLST